MALKKVKLRINPRRLVYGLSRIGYTPGSSVCDIVDNAVDWHAKKIWILIRKIDEELNDRRLNNIKEYLIIDDGDGMDRPGLENALMLGASNADYGEQALSKFGLGLKSAAFAQGDRLEVISATADNRFQKMAVDLTEIDDEYFATEEPLCEEDRRLISEYLPDGHGTIVRIAKIHQTNHPSIHVTKQNLHQRLGVIYYYFLQEDLEIFLDGAAIEPFDVLFVDEANQNGNLDEDDWDGKTTRWIARPNSYTIDSNQEVSCRIEVTQLPYPPIFELDGEKKRTVRDKYNIAAGNYGYYVYRNRRLISWAQGFDGIIPQRQHYFAFRGRILIDSSADDCFNIDVKKSNIALSGEASTVIGDLSLAFTDKSRKAWNHAKTLVERQSGRTPNQIANQIASSIGNIDDLPYDMNPTEEEAREKRKRVRQVEQEFKRQLQSEAKKRKRSKTGKEPADSEITEQDLQDALGGAAQAGRHIMQVDALEDNVFWMPYFDAEHGNCVRINQSHRFARLLYEDNAGNQDMQIFTELLLWQLANAEVYVRTHCYDMPPDDIVKVLNQFRLYASDMLAALCRNTSTRLPPFPDDDV